MAEWLPKDPATLAEIGGALGSGGLVIKFWDQIFAWTGRRHEREKDLQTIIDDRLKILLDAQETDRTHLSEDISSLRSEVAGLKKVVQILSGHIASLESLLRSKSIDVPPRPFAPVE